MPRSWVSVPLLKTGVRIGRSIADSELHPRMAGWVKYERANGLREAAHKRGEAMTWRHANYLVEKGFALGELDARGEPIVHVRGSNAAELARQLTAGAEKWNVQMTYEAAMQTATETIRRIDNQRRFGKAVGIGLAVIAALFIFLIAAAAHASPEPSIGDEMEFVCDDPSWHPVGGGNCCPPSWHRVMDACVRDAPSGEMHAETFTSNGNTYGGCEYYCNGYGDCRQSCRGDGSPIYERREERDAHHGRSTWRGDDSEEDSGHREEDRK